MNPNFVCFLHSGRFLAFKKGLLYTHSGQTRIEPNEFKKQTV